MSDPGGASCYIQAVVPQIPRALSDDAERLAADIFALAAHDLKTPATVIKAQAQLLKRRFKASAAPDLEEGLTMIADQADRLSRLLNLLLDLSRLEAGRFDLDLTPTDLRGVLIDMAHALQTTTEVHLIDVCAPVAVIGVWDQRRIEEVVQNLLANALKYSPAGGQIVLCLEADADNALVSVRDPGMGLRPQDRRRVFERFYRGQGTRRLEGAGLGLYISQAIVIAHGGKIWAESDGPGRGSRFSFSLPLRPALAATRRAG
ncbi:MAG TPA: HAMP domain-containing sensor histidine kinase [Chloroflexota bacterium]